MLKLLKRVFCFYVEGFKSMTVGKTLWIIILVKLFIMFVVLRLIFFPDFLKSKFKTEKERENYVLEKLSKP
ncbi:MAG: DUF4492 domain-containing protein [Bacteroidales bacterium]|nr:DUF4492 domain-containing protein [Bacteroidales bacterium]